MSEMKSVVAAVKRAVERAGDASPSFIFGQVTAWASPKATVNVAGATIPGVMTTEQVRSAMSVGKRVRIMVQGSVTIIDATI